MDQYNLEDYPWTQLCSKFCARIGYKRPRFRITNEKCVATIDTLFEITIDVLSTKTKTKNMAAYKLMMQISELIDLPSELIDWVKLVRYHCLYKYGVEPIYNCVFNSCSLTIPGFQVFEDIPTPHKDRLEEIISYKFYWSFIFPEM